MASLTRELSEYPPQKLEPGADQPIINHITMQFLSRFMDLFDIFPRNQSDYLLSSPSSLSMTENILF